MEVGKLFQFAATIVEFHQITPPPVYFNVTVVTVIYFQYLCNNVICRIEGTVLLSINSALLQVNIQPPQLNIWRLRAMRHAWRTNQLQRFAGLH
jgi:hypothetical protein